MTASLAGPRVGARDVAGFLFALIFVCALLFPAAGTLRWAEAWVFVAVYVALAVGSRLLVARRHPDLAAERAGFASAAGVKAWDKVLGPLVSVVGSVALLVTAGLDYRFGWSPALPLWVKGAALLGVAGGFAFSTWAMLANRNFSAVVRIQADRGHAVASGGPYRYVRHPGYVGAVVCYLAIPLALGSLWALVPGVVSCVLVITRTALEDKMLRAELPGYEEYAGRVRWRLAPGVW
jgi:protein-S-isoprenylcysteine O-methyltransferase Ste14